MKIFSSNHSFVRLQRVKMLKIFIVSSFLVSFCCCLQWVDFKAKSQDVPKNGVIGGYESGQANYIMRARHNDGLYPGIYNPKTGKAFLSVNGNSVEKDSIQVLTGSGDTIWSKNLKDKKPSVRAGYSTQGESLYVCRAWVGAGRLPGRLQNKKCVVLHNGVEKEMKDFEILRLFKKS